MSHAPQTSPASAVLKVRTIASTSNFEVSSANRVVSVPFPSTNKMNRDRSTLSPERRHLTNESIMRIQITLSSRKSSVVVFNTYARLVAVGNGRWDSVAVGAPCILLVKETSALDSRFQVRLAIAEVETGISIWEEELDSSTNYSELQPTFHTFTADGQSLALQFADAIEASSLIDSLKQYIAQKTTTDLVLDGKNSKGGKGKKSKLQEAKRVSKMQISSPCEFRHLSGITAGNPSGCQQELEDSVIRRQRSASMSAISTKNVKQRSKIPKGMADDSLYLKSDKENKKRPPIETPDMETQPFHSAHNRRGLFKSSSVRITKRKPIIEQIKTSDDSSVNSTPSRSTLNSSQEPSYWTIEDLRSSKTKNMEKLSSNRENEPTAITFKNSAPSQIQQAWRNSINTEDSSSKSSRSSTPHHNTTISPTPELFQLERRQTWSDGLQPLNSSPAHVRLNTGSPEHQASTNILSSPLHIVAAANAKKYLNVKPNFNTYDTLLPLEAGKKLPPLAPISNNVQKENSLLKHLSAAKTITTKPPPLSLNDNNSVVTPPSIDSPGGDLDVLSAELSKVLKDFDSLIAPTSPLEPTFQYTQTFAKETMV